jgi:hypothetical protein
MLPELDTIPERLALNVGSPVGAEEAVGVPDSTFEFVVEALAEILAEAEDDSDGRSEADTDADILSTLDPVAEGSEESED